jgi:hypothetical protein
MVESWLNLAFTRQKYKSMLQTGIVPTKNQVMFILPGMWCCKQKLPSQIGFYDSIRIFKQSYVPSIQISQVRACLAGLLTRGSSGAVLVKPQIVASPKRLWLLCFLLKSGFSRKTFGRVPLEEPEPKPERSPAKQALNR